MNRISRWLPRLGLLLALAPLGGCYTIHYEAQVNKPILTAHTLSRPNKITQHFRDHSSRVYLFWGLLPVAGADGTGLIDRYKQGGDGIVNLAATERFDFWSVLTQLLTVGVVGMRTIDIEGDVFVYTQAVPLPPATP